MKPRLLGIGYGQNGYGFGRVFQSLYDRWSTHWHIEHLEFGPGPSNEGPVPIHHTRRPGAVLGHLELRPILDRVKPDVVFYSDDPWRLGPYAQALRAYSTAMPMLAYLPVGTALSGHCATQDWAPVERLAVPTHYGKEQLAVAMAGDGLSRQIQVIPHGVDPDVFYPLSTDRLHRQRLARRQLFCTGDYDNTFFVFNGNRNQPRKRFDLTIEGFARFATNKDSNVRLLLHTGTIDEGLNITALASRFGVADRIVRPFESKKTHPVISDRTLNLLYNCADVGLNTSTSEGWGLVSFEQAATGCAQIVPSFGASKEIWAGAAALLPTTPCIEHNALPAGAEASAGSVAAVLEDLYLNPDVIDRLAQQALQRTQTSECQWDAVAGKLSTALQSTLA